MRTYCDNNPEKSICDCINSSVPQPTETHYITDIQAKQATTCPDFCGNIIECLNAKKCNVTKNTFNNYCSGYVFIQILTLLLLLQIIITL